MTNLTSEQYRDIIKHIPDCTTEVPNVQVLLRRAVETFFKRFGSYPELAGVAPGKIGLFGEQTQFSDGLALPVATPMATIVVGRRARGTRYAVVTSADVGKPHKVNFSFSRTHPLGPGCPRWLNYIKGVIDNYPEDVPPFEAAIESSVPMGVGFGSTSAIEVATYSFIEVLVGKKSDPIDKAKALQTAEREFELKEVGLVDRITSIMAKDRHAMVVDCKTNEVEWVPFRNRAVTMIAVNSHLKDTLLGDEYTKRTKYLAKACEILGVENLRNVTEEDLTELENKVKNILSNEQNEEEEEEEGDKEKAKDNEEDEEEGEGKLSEISEMSGVWTEEEYNIMLKRTKFFVTEMNRINEAIEAWNNGDVETFGEKLKESHNSLKDDFEFKNPVLEFLVETSLQVEGVLGSRMTGMGLGYGGGIVSLVNKENVEKYCNFITEKFAEYEKQLTQDVKEMKQEQKQKQQESVKKKIHTKHYNPSIASSEVIGQIQDFLEEGGAVKKAERKGIPFEIIKRVLEEGGYCSNKKKPPCIIKVEKPEAGCGTWARFQKERQKNAFLRQKALEEEQNRSLADENEEEEEEEEEKGSSSLSSVSDVQLKSPSFYIISPFAGTRMMFVTKADILRSRYAKFIPHPKTLVRSALEVFEATYGSKVEAIALAPATLNLFGEFMEYHLGYLISMSLPLYVVTVGGRNDTVLFSVKTTSEQVEEPREMKCVIPSVRSLEMESRSWVNFVMGIVNEFKGHVPGFNAVIHSNLPIQIGLNSCAALQSSIFTYLENLTRECVSDPFQKIELCSKSEFEFMPAPTELVSRCSTIKFLPIFLCKEGHLMLINCKSNKISHYFFDNPSYVFLIVTCKKITTSVTVETLEERLKQCMEALDILDKKSLLNLDFKHLRCLRKRDATEETVKRTKYVFTEHQRTLEAVKALQREDYERVGMLMNQSHASLRDDYEVSSPEIESLIKLAMSSKGVLGAKMLGKGFNASIIVLIKLSDADQCIRYIRKNYKKKNDKPVFYITKPSGGAFAMNPTVDVPYIL